MDERLKSYKWKTLVSLTIGYGILWIYRIVGSRLYPWEEPLSPIMFIIAGLILSWGGLASFAVVDMYE